MRIVPLVLLVLLFGVQASCAREEDDGGGGRQQAPPAEVRLEVRAGAGLEKDIRRVFGEAARETGRVRFVREGGDRSFHVLGIDSSQAGIYCDSILTLSVVYLDHSGGYLGHFAATFPSENLPAAGRDVLADFTGRFP